MLTQLVVFNDNIVLNDNEILLKFNDIAVMDAQRPWLFALGIAAMLCNTKYQECKSARKSLELLPMPTGAWYA